MTTTPSEGHTPPEYLTQSFLSSTGTPKRRTTIIDKATGATYAVLKSPWKNRKIGDEIVLRYNKYASLLARLRRMEEALRDAREVLDCGGARHVYGSVDKAMALIAKIDAALSEQVTE